MTNNIFFAAMPVLASVFLLVALSGCSHIQTQAIKPHLNIPSQMYQCQDSGLRPKGEVIMESQVARYISNLEASNKDCKLSLEQIKIIVECYNDKTCNVDKIIQYMGLVDKTRQR